MVAGITTAGQDHGQGVLGPPAQAHVAEHAVDGTQQQLHEIGHQPWHEHLALWVAEPDIVLDELRAARGQHQAGVQDAGEGRSLGGHPGQRRAHDLRHHPFDHRGVEARGRRVGTHPAGVRPLVAVEGALVILGGADLERVHAVAQREQACLLAVEELLDHDRAAGGAEAAGKSVANGRHRLGRRHRHHDTLAGGQAVRLDDDGRALGFDMGQSRGFLVPAEGPERRGRDGMPGAERLGEGLRALEPRCRGGRTESLDAGRPQPVDQSQHQRHFGSDHDQADPLGHRQRHQPHHVVGRHGQAACLLGDAGIARRAEHLLDQRRCRQHPAQRMLPPTGADHQHLHPERPVAAGAAHRCSAPYRQLAARSSSERCIGRVPAGLPASIPSRAAGVGVA